MENSKERLIKIKDIVIFILLFLWMIMPIFQTFKVINEIIQTKELYLILMRTIAIVGIGLGISAVYDKLKKAEGKKEITKGISPIFIFLIYMAWTLISCLQADLQKNAFYGDIYRKEGYLMYINYAGFFFSAMLLENKKLRKILLNTFIITSIFLMSINRICLDGKRYQNIFENTEIATSVFYNSNHYGYYLMLSLTCALGLFMTEKNKVLKVFYLVTYALIGYALIYNDTFGCYLAVLTILTLYGIYAVVKKIDRKEIFIAIAIFAVLSGITFKDDQNLAYKNISRFGEDIKIVFCKSANIKIENIDEKFDQTGSSRMKLWKYGIEFISKKPIIGYGPDNLEHLYLTKGIDQDRPHNLIIYLSCVSGIPGMLIYVTAVGIIVIEGIKKLYQNDLRVKLYLIVIITYLTSAMFGNSMFYTSPYFFIFLGSLMYYNLKEQEQKF